MSEDEKSNRLNELFEKHEDKAFELAKKYEGQTLKVLVEKFNPQEGRAMGRSTQNKLVHFTADQDLIGQTVSVKIREAFPQTLRGEQVKV